MNRILKDFFEGKTDIPEDVFWKNYNKLSEGVSTGYGSLTEVGDATLVHQLKNNVAVFSAFKANHYAAAMHALLVDEKGVKREWGNFLKEAKKVDASYNKTWLAAEYNMATRQARSAKQWQDFVRDKDVYPNLKFMPSRSATPDLTHMKFYGLVYPIDHPFWDYGMPPLRWGCKCGVSQTRDEATEDVYEAPEPPEGVAGNSGKTGKVFTASSHYLDILNEGDVDKVTKFLNDQQSKNVEVIIYPIGKNHIEIPVTSDPKDLSESINYLEPFVKKYKENYGTNPHIGEGKKPELNKPGKKKVIGDLTTWKNSINSSKYIETNFKSKYSKQLKEFENVFVAFDFNGKLTTENFPSMWSVLNGRLNNPEIKRLRFVLLKNGDKVLRLKQGVSYEDGMALISKELL